jgi:hypothetical protein
LIYLSIKDIDDMKKSSCIDDDAVEHWRWSAWSTITKNDEKNNIEIINRIESNWSSLDKS